MPRATKKEIIEHFKLFQKYTGEFLNYLPKEDKVSILDHLNEELNELNERQFETVNQPEIYERLSNEYTIKFELGLLLSQNFRMNEQKGRVFTHVCDINGKRLEQVN